MGITVFRNLIIMTIIIMCVLCCQSHGPAGTFVQSVMVGREQSIGLSDRYVYMRIGMDTAVVTTRSGGWAIDSIRIYEDISGSRLLDKTFCLSEKYRNIMRRNSSMNRRYGWLTITTGKKMIRIVVSRTLMANERRAVIYLNKGMYTDSVMVELEKDRFTVGGREYGGN